MNEEIAELVAEMRAMGAKMAANYSTYRDNAREFVMDYAVMSMNLSAGMDKFRKKYYSEIARNE